MKNLTHKLNDNKMLLKCSNLESGKGKGKVTRASTVMRMTMSTGSTMTSRVHRKVLRIPSKRHPGKALPGKIHSAARIGGKVLPGKRLRPQQSTHCDNSNDSGLGYDQYADTPYANIKQIPSTRLPPSSGSTTDSATICTSRLAANGNIQIDLRGEASTSATIAAPVTTIGMNAMLIDKTQMLVSSPSSSSASSINPLDSDMLVLDELQIRCQNLDQKIDIDDTCSNDAFAFNSSLKGKPLKSNQKTTTVPCNASKITTITRGTTRPTIRRQAIGSQMLNAPNNNMGVSGTVTLQTQIGAISQNGKCQLQILAQPEQQHRARYQTEGSRGAVKDRSGNGFPIVKLMAYDKPATLQIFIGTDVGRVAPHMFYQACKVSGKNSTPCNEKKVEGTIVIEIDLKPETDMTATCDCVGILKERNVDVEHRFPDQTAGPRSKKKSTRCRMVFRTQITHDDGTIETLQVCSQQIICTQPPGVPEICKKSLVSCPANGGLELFIIGKNFLKDTRVIFQARRLLPPASESYDTIWEESVFPDKEFLQQTHLICTVPPYVDPNIVEPVTVQMLVTSSNKFSEPHNFVYTPKSAFGAGALAMASTLASLQHAHSKSIQDMEMGYGNEESRSMSPTSSPVLKNAPASCSTLMLWANHLKETSNKIDAGIMPPPATTLPLNIRRTSLSGLLSCGSNDQSSPPMLKAEILDENSQSSILSNGAESLHDTIDYVSENSMDASNPATLMSTSPLDMMAANSFPAPPPLMNITSTSPINVVDLRVKQEDGMAAQIQDLVHPTLVEPPKLISGVPVPDASLMAPFGRPKLNDLKVQVDDVQMFNAPNSTDIMLNNNLGTLNHVGVTPMTTNQQMQQTMEQQSSVFGTQGLMTEAGTANGLNHMLSFPSSTQAISPNILSTSPTNPLTTDVMLNSQAIPTINTSPNSMLTVEPVNNSTIESDIIMNSTISPTMMCNNTSTDPATLLPNAVAIGDAPAMITQPPQQPTSEALLNNFIQPMSIKQSDAAVKNMILNAAAEILSSEPNSITPETATNALIEHVMITEQTPQTTNASPPSITNILTHSDSTNSVVVLAGSNKLIQNVVAAAAAQNASDIIQNQMVNADPISANPQIVNVQPTTTAASAAAANLTLVQQSLLNNIQQEICALSTETIVGDQLSPKRDDLSAKPRKMSEPMVTDPIVSVAQTIATTSAVIVTATNPPTTGTIPPDLTTMSDHDLISYINPSCFDQVHL
ncbi:nuclear factor of activated T-cells 5-like isoform X2 [Contarinia nasturtii]|uniref:nuclear factor of activated T-cells 5-like isoform X2 n=1 Tax=Contarinia nasturtii TaxID=265458 RepID=UPI0012D48945|nr:nuclear factor of activated T-cells 5-like isoform X2 [Contarinia nasturtii]XP_031624807.1 nuclear factor of activated T-cells 5-like isoform X2 [Contarinia nasturtii]